MLVTRVRPGLAKSRRRAIEEEDERFNPIHPLMGNTVMRGGAMAMDPPASSRNPRRGMADKRAMEVQMRNQTPGTGATPTMGVSQMRGGSMGRVVGGAMGRCVGGSATPSMGLSEFRGGGPVEMLLDRSNVSKSGAYEGQGMLRKKSQPELEFSSNMKGGKKHHMNGGALSEHLLKEMGAPSHKALLMGMMDHAKGVHGGAWWDDVRGAFQDFGRKVKNEFVNPESVLRSQVLPKAAQIATVAAPLLDKARPGLGTAIAKGAQTAQGANAAAKSVGLGRRKRAPASAGDGRRKRADIVRKVMNERGCSMIEASKIVKSEGLY